MSLDIIHARHAAMLGTLEIPFKKDGWTTQFIEPGTQSPINVLICKPANTSVPSIYLSYIPLDDDSNELELMQITCDLPGAIPNMRLTEVMTLLHSLNVTMPLGAFCISPMRTTYLRHIYAHEINSLPHIHDVIKMGEMISGTAGVFHPMIQLVVQGKAAAEVIAQIGQQDMSIPDITSDEKGSLFEQVKAYLERKGMKYETAMDMAAIVIIRGKNAQFNLVIQLREEDQQVVIYAVSPVITPPEHLQEMAFFLTLANYGIFIGNFELDVSDGEVRYKVSHELAKQPLTDDVLSSMVQNCASTFDQYAVGLKAVSEGTASAQEAIAHIEG